jgi:NADH-quinone oxidoreductase subunit M
MIYERFHTRSIANLGGIATKAPWLTVFFMLFTFSSIGLPGLNGFVGEFLILAGSFQRAWTGVASALRTPYLVMAVSAVAGVVLGAWYMLWAVERVFFGGSREPPRQAGVTHGHDAHGHDAHGHDAPAGHDGRCDLEWYEVAAVLPLAVFVLWIGLTPATFLAPPAAMLRAATRGATTAFDAQMRDLDDRAPTTPAAPVADRVVGHDHGHAASRQPFTLTSKPNPDTELTLDRP